MAMGRLFKNLLTRIGSRLSTKTIFRLNSLANYLEVGRWMSEKGFRPPRVKNRESLFPKFAEKIANSRVLYLEFGVYKGDSIREWAQLLKNPQTHLHGFDSFEGLPEDWTMLSKRGLFTMEGAIPKIDDPRVQFFAGWFDQTLPGYEAPAHDQLFVNIDCDLYSSTKTVLDLLRSKDLIKPGTYIYFDEFNDRDHELKAFDEFLQSTNWKFESVIATSDLTKVVFQRIE